MSGKTNLKQTASKGLFWSGIERFGSQGIQLIFGIIITRILLPEDYALLGMILIFMAVGQALIDGGFSSALIFKKNPLPVDYSTVFFFNLLSSLLLFLILFLIAPWVASFYEKQELINLIRISGLNLVIVSLSLVQMSILQKKFDFRLLAVTNIIGSLIAGIVSVFLAMKGFGTWALVAQLMIKSFLTSLFLWVFCKWIPLFKFSFSSLKQMFGFGSRLTLANLVYSIFQNIYNNIIGKLFPLNTLGFYTRSVQLQEFPVKTLTSIFQRVAFPVFSSINDDKERLKNAFRKTIKTISFISFPFIFGLIAVSDELFFVLFTEKWVPASVYFKLLCVIGLFFFFLAINGEILKAKGKSGWILNIELITKSILIINILITYRWGVEAIILGQLVSVLIGYALGTYFVWKLIGYTLSEQLNDVKSYFLLSFVMYVFCLLIGKSGLAPLYLLILKTLFGIVFYSTTTLIFKLPESNDVVRIVNKLKFNIINIFNK